MTMAAVSIREGRFLDELTFISSGWSFTMFPLLCPETSLDRSDLWHQDLSPKDPTPLEKMAVIVLY